MSSIPVLILDDDATVRALLKGYVEAVPQLTLAGVAASPIEATSIIATTPVDLLFLDIGLPEFDGFRFLATLPRKPAVIVVSADPLHAVTAFDHSVVDFLQKPFGRDRFMKAVQRAMLSLREAPAAASVEAGPEAKGHAGGPLLLRSGDRTVVVSPADILGAQSVGNYVKVYLATGPVLAKLTMQSLLTMLPAGAFARVHRSWVVACRAVEAVEAGAVQWRGQRIVLGATYKRQAIAAIAAYAAEQRPKASMAG